MNNKEEEWIREARREYKRRWNRAHKDKVREYNRRYWLKKALKNKGGEDKDE